MSMRRFQSFLVPAFALLAFTASAQAPQGQTTLPNLVSSSGNAEIKLAPDMATIRIGVETQGKTAKEAQASTNLLANRIIDAALKIVPDRKAYQTSDLSLFPEYTQPGGGGGINGGGFGGGSVAIPEGPKLIGYRARNVLTIRIDDISKVGPLVDAVTDAGASNIDSISFGLKNDKAARRQALVDAVREAREKAEAMAEGAGLRLGDVFSIEEGGGTTVRPYEMARMADMKMETPVMPGEVSVGAMVTVRFRLVR